MAEGNVCSFNKYGFCTKKVNDDKEVAKLKTKIKDIEEVIKEKSKQIETLENILSDKETN